MPKPYLTDDVRNYDYGGAARSYGRQFMSALRPADTLDAYTTNGIPRRLP